MNKFLVLIYASILSFNFILISCSLYSQQDKGIPFVTNYTPELYNAEEQNWCAVKDNRGIMYFGNNEALLEYDGLKWRKLEDYTQTVRSLHSDSSGTIYIGSINDFGYLTQDSIGKNIYCSLALQIDTLYTDFSDISAIYSICDTTFFCSREYIFKFYDDKYLSTIRLPDYSFLSFNVENELYTGNYDLGLLKIYKDTVQKVDFGKDFIKKDIVAIKQYNDSIYLFSTYNNGVFFINKSLGIQASIDFPSFINSYFLNNKLYHCSQINQNFVFSTLNNGIVLTDLNFDRFSMISLTNGLNDKTVTSSYMNKKFPNSEQIWLTLNNGISKLEINSPFRILNENNGLYGIVNDIIHYKDKLYVATSLGVYYCDYYSYLKSDFKPINNINRYSWHFFNMPLKSINYSNKEQMLLVATDNGIFSIEDSTAKILPFKNNYSSYNIAKAKNDQHILFIGTKRGLYSMKYHNGKWSDGGYINNITDEIRNMIFFKNSLWMGTDINGILRYNYLNDNDTVFEFYGLKKGVSDLNWNVLFQDKKLGLLTSNDLGIQKYNEKSDVFEPFFDFGDRYANGDVAVYKITSDRIGHYWLIVSDGSKSWIEKVIMHENGEVEIQKAPFNRLQNKSLDVIYHDKDSITWIGHSKGIYKYDAKFKRSYKNKFYCLIRKVDLNSDSTIFYGTMTDDSNQVTTKWQKKYEKILPYKDNTISFEYAAPFFENEKATIYSFYLKGFDKKWSKWSKETKAIYTNLPEGDYIFCVKAKNTYDYESKTGEYHFSILAPFYRTTIAYVAYFIALVLFIWSIVRLNSLRLRKQNDQLEQIINERTEEIRAQKDQIEMQNEELIRLDEYKQGLTGMIVHDLKNPLNHILNVPDSEPKKNLQLVKQSGKQMLNMVLDILDVSKYENTTMDIEQKDVQVAEILSKAIEQVLFLAENKNISFHLNIPDEQVIFADSEIIERICINLFTNAIKYSPNNSVVGACSKTEGDYIRIEICNTGSYIAPELIDKVFDKFSQIEAKKSGSIRSTGLGLTFCKMAIEAHMGEIGVESDKEKGTSFWFILPKGQKDIQIVEYNLSKKYKKKSEDLSSTFTSEDIIYLQPFIADLKQVKVYQLSKSKKILDTIQSSGSAAIDNWKSKLMQAIFNGNQEEYDKLLGI